MAEVAKAYVTIIPTMQGAQQTITKELTGAAAPAGTAAGEKVGSSLSTALGSKMSSMGKTLTKSVTAPIVAIGTASVAAWKSVDNGLDIVTQKTGATGEALTAMQDSVKNIASTIPTSFEAAGNAVGEVNTRFGLTGQALEDLSTQFVKFADLNSTDVSSSIDNVQRVLSAFGMSASDAGGYLDVLNAVGQQTGIDMNTLATSLATNAASLQEMGMNATQAAQFLGSVEMSGMDTSAAMMGLKTAMKNAADEGMTLTDALSEWNGIMNSSASDTDKLNASIELFGSKAGAQFYNAAKQGTLSLDTLSGSMSDFEGSVSSTFENTKDPLDSLQTVFNELKIAGADLVEAVGPILSSALSTLAGVITQISAAWSSLSPGAQEAIVTAALVAAAIGPVLSVGGRLVSGIGSLISFVPKLVSGIGTVVAAMGPVGIAIAAVIAVGVLLIKHWDEIKAAAAAIKDAVVQKWEELKTGVSEKVSAVWSTVTGKFNEIKSNVVGTATEIWSTVTSKFESIRSTIQEKIGAARDFIQGAVEKIKGFFKFEWSLPPIKLPHFSISGKFSLNPPSIPHINVDWYAKAMGNAMLLNDPTIFGMSNGKFLGGGEAGAEVVAGANSLMQMIRSSVRSELIDSDDAGGRQVNIYVYGERGQDVDQLADAVARKFYQATQRKAAYA